MDDKYPYNLINKIYSVLKLRNVAINEESIKGLEYLVDNILSNIQKSVIRYRYLDELSIVSTARKMEEDTGKCFSNVDIAEIEKEAIALMAHVNNAKWIYFGYSKVSQENYRRRG